MRGRRRIGSMSGCGALAALVGMAGAALASGQTNRRPALWSGSASVTLIARVESLSVVANAETALGSMVAGGAATALPVSITTSWAVPANFTTFRVTRYFGGPESMVAGQDGSQGAAAGSIAGDGVGSLVVESGETNQAKTRTDLLDGVGGGEKKSAEGRLLNILVQPSKMAE